MSFDDPIQWNIERAREHLQSAQKIALEDKEKHALVIRSLATALEALDQNENLESDCEHCGRNQFDDVETAEQLAKKYLSQPLQE